MPKCSVTTITSSYYYVKEKEEQHFIQTNGLNFFIPRSGVSSPYFKESMILTLNKVYYAISLKQSLSAFIQKCIFIQKW